MKSVTATFLLFFCINTAIAFDALTPVQTQIYDYPHLSSTKENMSIAYHYSGMSSEDMTLSDTVKLHIGKANAERRDVEIEFLSGERRMHLPPFPDYRGNPVIIVMLEHIAQSFGTISGGGALYFRNRIRNTLAKQELEVLSSKQQMNGQTYATRTISFKPFQKDPNLAATPHLQESLLSITLSDDVLGGVLQISIESPDLEGIQPFKRSITFIETQPAE